MVSADLLPLCARSLSFKNRIGVIDAASEAYDAELALSDVGGQPIAPAVADEEPVALIGTEQKLDVTLHQPAFRAFGDDRPNRCDTMPFVLAAETDARPRPMGLALLLSFLERDDFAHPFTLLVLIAVTPASKRRYRNHGPCFSTSTFLPVERPCLSRRCGTLRGAGCLRCGEVSSWLGAKSSAQRPLLMESRLIGLLHR